MLLPLQLRYPDNRLTNQDEDLKQLAMATTNKPQATSHWSGALI